MDQNELLRLWNGFKTKGSNYLLKKPCVQDYEYKGPQYGHPSNYAYVKFECEPAKELNFVSACNWPSKSEKDDYENGILRGIVDGLMSNRFEPYRGCLLKLVSVRTDDAMSSQVAFYRATRKAMESLIAREDIWERIP